MDCKKCAQSSRLDPEKRARRVTWRYCRLQAYSVLAERRSLNPCDRANSPEVWECTPEVWECTPEDWECTPEVWECTPEVWELTPEVWECTPEDRECTPEDWECTPE